MTFDRHHMVELLRRDAALVLDAVVAAVFISFVAVALGAAVFDLMLLRR